MSKKVGKDVGKGKTSRYVKGKYPYTVFDTKTGQLYVRKSTTLNKMVKDKKTGEEKFVRQRQTWRVCDPPTAANAEALLKEINAEILLTQTGLARPLSKFEEIAEEFEKIELRDAVYEKGKKIDGRRSVAGARSAVKMIKSHFGHYQIKEITFGAIQAFKIQRLGTPVVFKTKSRPRSIRTVHYELGFLRQIFNFAYRHRWIDRSPFDDGKNLITPTDESRRHITWTRAEEATALAFCKGKRLAHLKPVIICITDGGFRRSELLNLKWSEVDFENGVMPAKSYKGKNLSARSIFMTDRMRSVLLEWKIEQKNCNVTDPSLVIGYQDIKNAWETIRGKIGRKDLRIHDLRHIFATRLALEAKSQISVISKALGHSSVKTTEIYINAHADDVRHESAKLNELNKKYEKTAATEKADG